MAAMVTLFAAFALVSSMFTGVASAAENSVAAAPPAVQTLLFQIRPRYSPNKCLDNSQPGAVTLRACADPAPDGQLWQVTESTQGLNNLKSINGLCLDVANAGTANGTPVGLFTCNGQNNQKFALVFLTGPYYQARAAHSLTKCLDVKNDVAAEGAPLQLWDCLGSTQTNQQFKFVSA
jgi:Ricin-type beta-trefoil lectin domain-like